jgi:hypothetical protein
MEVHGSRSEIIAKMRQARTEKLKAKLAQEGIAGLDIEHTYPEVKSFHVTEQHGNADRFDHTSEERGYPEQENYDYRSENVSGKRDERTPPKYDSYVQPKPQVDEEARFYSISPSANLSSPQLKFYQNAINTVKRKQMTDALKTQEIKKQANEKKINEKSEQLLFDKMRYKLRESIYEVCSTEASPFTFEKLGRVLTLLNFIHFISYQEDCQPSFDSDINDRIDQLRRLEEVGMLFDI